MSNNVTTEKQNAELSADGSANGVSVNQTFEDVLSEIEKVLKSDMTGFCKTFAISELVKPEIIYNIDIPEIEMSDELKVQLQTM